jgi:amidase
MDDSFAFASALDLAKLVRERKASALELLDAYLARVERLNPRVNAVILQRPDEARALARQRDAEVAEGGELGPLHGVPMTVKESFDIPGLPTTWGFTEQRDNIAERPALAVERLEQAGAVIFGKTNVPVALADWQSFNPIYGTTNNPWNVERVPGGSSGGSAAALAAGLTGLELGSDIGGSIRGPAHFCGVYGHKPTYDLAPGDGQALPGKYAPTDITVIGPLARSARDLEVALTTVAGPNPRDARGYRLALPPEQRTKLSDFRVGVMLTAPSAEVDGAVQREIEKLGHWLEGKGARVDWRAVPTDPSVAHEAYIMLLRAATAGRLTEEQIDKYKREAESIDPARDDYYAWMVRGVTMTHWEWLRWDNERHRIRRDWERFFESYDLLLCPAAATTAFPHNQSGERWERMVRVNGADQPSTTQMLWAGYSGMVFLPSTVAPIGRADDGMPVGVQIVGPQYGDLTSIRFAELIEREYGGFVPPPGFQ